MATKIAALFVLKDGPYIGLDFVDPWTIERDAKLYNGPHPVVAHPPCERWGRYWSGGPSAKVKRALGDDDGCFNSALNSVWKFGGVLEHPAYSHAWKHFDLLKPIPHHGWSQMTGCAWVCHVEQGNYGHLARKATWLLYVGKNRPFELNWGHSKGIRLDEGFHSKEERNLARQSGQRPIKRLSKKQNALTPLKFRDLLLDLVKKSK